MSYSTQNLGSLMDDLGSDESAGRGKSKARKRTDGQPFWKSQGFAITLAVIAVSVLAGGTWYSFFSGGPPRPPGAIVMIDIQTGELFHVSTKRLAIPTMNPTTELRNLYPVFKSQDGDWEIGGHYLEGVENRGFNQSVVIDLASGKVRPSSSKISKLK
jgi:hypothetical protein